MKKTPFYYIAPMLLVGLLFLQGCSLTYLNLTYPKWDKGAHRLVETNLTLAIRATEKAIKELKYTVYQEKDYDEKAYAFVIHRHQKIQISGPTDPHDYINDDLRIVLRVEDDRHVRITALERNTPFSQRTSQNEEKLLQNILSHIQKVYSDPTFKAIYRL
jgi:hypothetical protein